MYICLNVCVCLPRFLSVISSVPLSFTTSFSTSDFHSRSTSLFYSISLFFSFTHTLNPNSLLFPLLHSLSRHIFLSFTLFPPSLTCSLKLSVINPLFTSASFTPLCLSVCQYLFLTLSLSLPFSYFVSSFPSLHIIVHATSISISEAMSCLLSINLSKNYNYQYEKGGRLDGTVAPDIYRVSIWRWTSTGSLNGGGRPNKKTTLVLKDNYEYGSG